MKSYEETISTVFDRVEQYHIKQKRKRKVLLSTVTPLCLIAVCISGFLVLKSISPKPSAPNGEAPNSPISMDSVVLPTSPVDIDPVTVPAKSNDKIIINPIKEVSEQRMNIALLRNDEILMTLEDLSKYYGTNIVPEVPEDLIKWDESYRIYKRDNGTGEIYWDQNMQRYSNEDRSKRIFIDTRKGQLPFYSVVFYEPETESSIINDLEVDIGLSEYGCYSAWFMYQNTGFHISAEGVTEEELIAVIKSLIQ